MGLRSAFCQLEIAEEARYLTVFHPGGKLFHYKLLVMDLKPAQGELNAELQPLFAHLPQVHVIHDDIVIATETESEHITITEEVMKILSVWSGAWSSAVMGFVLTQKRLSEALDHLGTPNSKERLVSFLCIT